MSNEVKEFLEKRGLHEVREINFSEMDKKIGVAAVGIGALPSGKAILVCRETNATACYAIHDSIQSDNSRTGRMGES
ncbi:MAG: hypothetical protein KGI54_05800 [Pseudomonadota bacterium]|nr:hypothetical protein [Pseudomonadota bacterium]